METRVPVEVFKLFRNGKKLRVPRVGTHFGEFGDIRKGLFKRELGIGGHHFGDGIYLAERNFQHPPDILDCGFRLQCSERDNLPDALITVFSADIVDNLLPPFEAKVNVKVRHGNTFGIKEAFKQQLIFERVDIGDPHRIGDNRTRPGTASRPNRNAVLLRPVDKVPYDEEVPDKVHLHNNAQLIVGALGHLFGNGIVAFL